MLTQDVSRTRPSIFGGCSLQKWSESPLNGGFTPLLKINQEFCFRGEHYFSETRELILESTTQSSKPPAQQ